MSYQTDINDTTVSPIDVNGIRLESTPIGTNFNIDKTDTRPINVDFDESDERTPRKSILRNSTSDLTLSDSLLRRHPSLRMATSDGKNINPVKGARVIFSPTKDILSSSYEDGELRTRHERASITDTRSQTMMSFGLDDKVEDHPEKKPSFGSRLLTDPKVPYVLSLYLQLVINIVVISIIFYMVYTFINTIKADINQKLEIYTREALQEISLCSREYYRNKCSLEDGNKRAPALEQTCTKWSKCMNRDPQLIGRSKITAETVADIINGFMKPITWKSLIFLNIMIFGSLAATNLAFGSYRNTVSSNEAEELKQLKQRLRAQEAALLEYRLADKANDTLSPLQSKSRSTGTDNYL